MNQRTKKLKKGQIIPMNFDYVFTGILNDENNINILEDILALYFNKDVKKIRGKVKLKNRDIPIENKKKKNAQVDLILETDDKIINIEMSNSSNNGVKERNVVYACKMHGTHLKYRDYDYSKISNTIQINFNNFNCNEHKIKFSIFLNMF